VSASFDDGWIPFTGGDMTVSYELENTGNVRLTGSQLVDVEGPLGIGLTSVHPEDLPELLPGQKYTVTVEATGVQRLGRVTARLTVDPSSLNVPEGSPEPPSVTGVASAWAVPWPELVVLLVVVVLLWLLRRRSRGRRRRAAEAIAAAEARGRAAAAAEAAGMQAPRVVAVVTGGLLALLALFGLGGPTATASERPPGPGEIDVTVTVPSTTPTGDDTGADDGDGGDGDDSGADGGAAGDEDGTGEHPPTGADIAGWAGIGGLLLVFGTLMVRSMRGTDEAPA
jgi:type II secretory pathway pseudopilin PulG